MKGALIILAVTVLTGFLLWWSDKFLMRRRKTESDAAAPVSGGAAVPEPDNEKKEEEKSGSAEEASSDGSGECCGLHLMCEKSGDAVFTSEVIYYDDEELDRFAGRAPEEYSGEETEEFRDVLMTMLPSDVPGWAHSLDLRGIRPPQEIRDEILMLLREL